MIVFDEEIAFDNQVIESLKCVVGKLRRRTWSVLSLEGSHFENGNPMQALAYHESTFSHLLSELPTDEPGMSAWLEKYESLPEYLSTIAPVEYRTSNAQAAG